MYFKVTIDKLNKEIYKEYKDEETLVDFIQNYLSDIHEQRIKNNQSTEPESDSIEFIIDEITKDEYLYQKIINRMNER